MTNTPSASPAIKPPETKAYQQRVRDERKDLDAKLTDLRAFFQKPEFQALDPAERLRMEKQAEIMGKYSLILEQRITAFT